MGDNPPFTARQEHSMEIFKDGTLIEIKVCFWSGAKILKPHDLGIDQESLPEIYELGKKMLIPKKIISKFRAIESKARFIVEKNSFKFPFGNARFIPNRKVSIIIKKLKLYQKEYNSLKKEFITDYDKLRKQILPSHQKAAESACTKQNEEEKKKFIINFLNQIDTLYPNLNSLRNKFSLTWNIYEIALPRIKKEYHAQAKEKIITFLNEVITSLRKDTSEICKRIINTENDIKGPTVKALKNFITDYSELNFIEDPVITQGIEELGKNFLEKYTTPQIIKSKELQKGLKNRLKDLLKNTENYSESDLIIYKYCSKINLLDES